MEALEKAKKALQLQKEIQEKIKNKLPQLAAKLPAPPGGGPPAAPPPAAAMPGTASVLPGGTASVLPPAGRRPGPPGAPPAAAQQQQAAQRQAQAQDEEGGAGEEAEDPFFDPRMGTGGRRRNDRRRKAGFEFVEEGRYQHEAEVFRLKAQLGQAAFRRGAPRVAGPLMGPGFGAPALDRATAKMDANLVPLGPQRAMPGAGAAGSREGSAAPMEVGSREATPAPPPEPVPEVEWWDRGLLAHGSYATDVRLDGEAGAAEGDAMQQGGGGEAVPAVQIKEARVTHYVEHPVPLEPPAEQAAPPPQPLKLTAREVKKLRTQRRLAREKEKQELIRQGLLEPPKPKVRIANLARVLGTEATLDPTAIEQEVRKQMAERQAAHDDRNLSRKLTPAERRDKKLRKLFGADAADALGEGGAAPLARDEPVGNALDVTCSVYRIAPRGLSNPQHRFKVDVNAKENHMTGLAIQSDDFAVVVVEGCNKSTKRYLKLMMRRIDWTQLPTAEALAAEAGEADDGGQPNTCTLVWQGTVKSRAFSGFRTEAVRSGGAGRQLLADAGVGHYWDAACAAADGESLAFEL